MRRNLTEDVHIRLSSATSRFFHMVAKQQGTSVSKVLRDASEAAMQEHDIPNPVVIEHLKKIEATAQVTVKGLRSLRDTTAHALEQSHEKAIAAAVAVATAQMRVDMQQLLEAMLTAAKDEGKGVFSRIGSKVWSAIAEPVPREVQ